MNVLPVLLATLSVGVLNPVQASLVDGYNDQTRTEEQVHAACLQTHSQAQYREGERSNLVRYTVSGNQVQATKVYFGGKCEFLGKPLPFNQQTVGNNSIYHILVEGNELVRYIKFTGPNSDDIIRRGVWGTRF